MIELRAATTALILIDLQNGIVSRPWQPRTGDAVVAACKTLADRFRTVRAPVVAVNVAFNADGGDILKVPADKPSITPDTTFPPGWADLVQGVVEPQDLRVTKHQWGAFYGTDLDLQLRRRGIDTIVIGGIATNMGVESTARAAHEHGYAVVLAEDCCAGPNAEMHRFAFETIFPMIGRVTDTGSIALRPD